MKQLHLFTALTPILLLSAATFIGCGSDASNPPATGGFPGTGGLQGTGSVPASGGIPGSGGSIVGSGGSIVGSGGSIVGSGGSVVGSGGSGSGGAASGGATATGGASGKCEAAGTWGILFEVGIKWQSTGVLTCPAAGCAGVQQLKLLSTRTMDSTGKITDSARICAVTLPEFTTIVGPVKVEFPPAAWDSKPIIATLLSTQVGTGAGATFSSEDNAIIVGTTLTNPTTNPWPAPTAIVPVDADGDTKPGVTAVSPAPGAPTGLGTNNADKLFIAFRTVAKVSGKNDTCDKSTGTITLKGVEQGIIGCHYPAGGLVPTEGECDDAQKKFLNDGAPKWEVGTGSKLVMIRMADTATCADVRSAAF